MNGKYLCKATGAVLTPASDFAAAQYARAPGYMRVEDTPDPGKAPPAMFSSGAPETPAGETQKGAGPAKARAGRGAK